MKLFLLIVLLCGLTSTSNNVARQKSIAASNEKAATNFDMLPSGLLFQF